MTDEELNEAIEYNLRHLEHDYSIEEDLEETRKCLKETQQELQRKDNEIKQLREDIVNHIKIASEYKEQMIIKDNIINELKSSIADYQEAVGDYQDELKRKDNIINELKEWARLERYLQTTNVEERIYDEFLDKIKELENET